MLLSDWKKILFERQVERGYIRARIWAAVILFVLICLATGFYHSFKPMPEGLDYQSQEYIVNLSDINFLSDTTFADSRNQRQSEQRIFDTMFSYLDGASQYILLDMFLFNDLVKNNQPAARKLSAELTDKLLAKKQTTPDIRIDVIVDPINTVYGGYDSPQLQALSDAGVNVIVTNLNRLRDDNPFFSEPWRLLFGWWGNSSKHGWLPNPFGDNGQKVSLRSYLAMLNFKANHRKVFLADNQGELVSIIGSANAHDASAANSNAAVAIKGVFGAEVYKSEAAVAAMSGNGLQPLPQNLLAAKTGANQYAKVSLLTEGQIRRAAVAEIDDLAAGDQLFLVMFYLADRPVIKALTAAAARGVEIKIILDPAKDAFGYVKNGIPNRQVAAELLAKSGGKIAVRWYQTQGEQFHTKLMLTVKTQAQTTSLLLGSANFTKRNIGNYNLETDVRLTTRSDLSLAQAAQAYFNRLWTNSDGSYTVDYEVYRDDSRLNTVLYWLQEVTGISSF